MLDDNEEYPTKYIVAKVKFEPDKAFSFENADLIEQYTFDITKEADMLTASCTELHLIVSAGNWEKLEKKINYVYEEKVMEDFKDE